jgi:hypothetical protein
MIEYGNIGLYTNVKIRHYDVNGNWIKDDAVHNIVVSTGLDLLRDHLLSTAAVTLTPHHFVLGNSTVAVASSDVALGSSSYDISFTGSTIRTAGVTFNGSIYSTDGVGSTWNEIGLFTSSSSLYARALIAPIIKTSSQPTNQLIAWAFDLTATT